MDLALADLASETVILARLASNGTVIAGSVQVISNGEEGLPSGTFPSGLSIAAIASAGDMDGDGVEDLAVGAQSDSTAGTSAGAVYMLYLNAANESDLVRSFTRLTRSTAGLDGVA